MNYVRHLNAILDALTMDERILPRHISLYMALFHMWNKLKFIESMRVARQEVMSMCKIGSINTYIRTIKELDKWGYLHYKPSKSMYQGSGVTIITFDNTCDNSSGNTDDNTAGITSANTDGNSTNNTVDNTTEHRDDNTGDTPLNNNYKTILNKENSNKPLQTNREHTHKKLKDDDKQDSLKHPKTRFVKPSLKDLETYFSEKEIEPMEAHRFYNHFESNGWKVGGKSAMKDWKAAVRNWILNISRYTPKNKDSEINYLSAKNDKDYGEPL